VLTKVDQGVIQESARSGSMARYACARYPENSSVAKWAGIAVKTPSQKKSTSEPSGSVLANSTRAKRYRSFGGKGFFDDARVHRL